MKLTVTLRWSLLAALGLVGCTATLPANLSGSTTPGATGNGLSEALHPAAHSSTLNFRVHWPARPARAAQAVPLDTEHLTITVKDSHGEQIAQKTLDRPSTDQAVDSEAHFDLDPAKSPISISAQAKDASGTVIASGQRDHVVLYDNTVTAALIDLRLVDSGPSSPQLTIQLDLLRNLQGYFSRFDKLLRYNETDEYKDTVAVLQAAFGSMSPAPTQGDATRSVEGGVTIDRFVNADTRYHFELHDGQPYNYVWPGYSATFASSFDTDAHSIEVALKSEDGGNGTKGFVRATVTASQWEKTPLLDAMGYPIPGDEHGATASIMIAGNQVPSAYAFQKVALAAQLDPGGDVTRRLAAGVVVDDIARVDQSAAYALLLSSNNGYDPFKAYGLAGRIEAPSHASASIALPPGRIGLDARVDYDALSANLGALFHLKDNAGDFEDFIATASAQLGTGPGYNGSTVPTALHGKFTLRDEHTRITAQGTYDYTYNFQPDASSAVTWSSTLYVRFLDMDLGQVLGQVDWHVDQTTDMSKLASWPLLVLKDGSQVRMGPGYLSGKPGFLLINVQ